MEKLNILWYAFKLYNQQNRLIWTFNEDQIKNKIKFSETINSWQGELELILDEDAFNLRQDIFAIRVIIQFNVAWKTYEKQLYTGIIDYITKKKWQFDEITLRFIGLYKFYSDINHFNIKQSTPTTSTLEYSYEKKDLEKLNNKKAIDIVFKSLGLTEIEVDSILNIEVGDELVDTSDNKKATVLFKNTINISWSDHYYVWIYKQDKRFLNTDLLDIYRLWSPTWHFTTLSWSWYWLGDNIINYFLDFETTNIGLSTEQDFDFKIDKIMRNNDIIDKILQINPSFYYFLGENWVLNFKKLDDTSTKFLTFDKEIYELQKNEDFVVYNYITLQYTGWTIIVSDPDSIEKYWRKDYFEKDDSIISLSEAQKKANKILEDKKEKKIEVVLTCNIKDVVWKQNNVVSNVGDFTKTSTLHLLHIAYSDSLSVMVGTNNLSKNPFYSLDNWVTWIDSWYNIWTLAGLVAWSETLWYFISTPSNTHWVTWPVYKSLDWITWTSFWTISWTIQDKKQLEWVPLYNKFIICWQRTTPWVNTFMESWDWSVWSIIPNSPLSTNTKPWYRSFTYDNWSIYWIALWYFVKTSDLTVWTEYYEPNISTAPNAITDKIWGWLVAVWDGGKIFISEDYLSFTQSSIWRTGNLYDIKHNTNWTLYVIAWVNEQRVNYWIYKGNDLLSLQEVLSVDWLENTLHFANNKVLFTIDNCYVFSQEWVLRMSSTVWDISFELEQTIFDIEIGDKINVRNIDINKELSNLTVSKKEYNGDYITIYLNDYSKNFVEELKKWQSKISFWLQNYWNFS